MRIKIRQALEKDIPLLLEIWKAAGFYYPAWDTKTSLKAKMMLQPGLFLVATVGEQVAGGVIGTYDGWAAYINHLAVNPFYGNHETEQKLLVAIEQELKKHGAKKLFVLTMTEGWENTFYPFHGYTEWGLSKGFEKSI